MKVLIVEDDLSNAKLLKKLLEANQYESVLANSYDQGLRSIEETRFDMIVLDWNLPQKSGLLLLKELREMGIEAQVLMLSANTDVSYRVEALDAGADDYLCKPYAHLELIARINSLLRRSNNTKTMLLEEGDLKIDKQLQSVEYQGKLIDLTSSEYTILSELAFNPKKIFTKYELLNLIHNDYSSSDSNIIPVHIKNIRKKLDAKELIKTVRSVGYIINL